MFLDAYLTTLAWLDTLRFSLAKRARADSTSCLSGAKIGIQPILLYLAAILGKL
jgi:hypothetical protein